MRSQKEFDKSFDSLINTNDMGKWLASVYQRRYSSDWPSNAIIIDENKVQIIIDRFSRESFTQLANLVGLGNKVVHMNNAQLKYCISHEDYTVRSCAYQNFEIRGEMLNYCIDECLGVTLLTGREIMDVFLRKNYAHLTDKAIEVLQLKCNDYDCATMWWLGIGDSPIDMTDCIREYDFRKKAEPRLWLAWRLKYIIGLEAKKLKVEHSIIEKAVRPVNAL